MIVVTVAVAAAVTRTGVGKERSRGQACWEEVGLTVLEEAHLSRVI